MNPGMFKENLLFIGKVVYATETNVVYFTYLFVTSNAFEHNEYVEIENSLLAVPWLIDKTYLLTMAVLRCDSVSLKHFRLAILSYSVYFSYI